MDITHARVKYLADNAVEIIPIQDILEFKTRRPIDLNDFVKTKIYRTVYSDDKNPEPIKLKIPIADLACGTSGVSELEKSRPKFARLNDSNVPNTSSYSITSENDSEEENPLYQSTAQKTKKKKEVINERGKNIVSRIKKQIPKIIDSDDDSVTNETLNKSLEDENRMLRAMLANKEKEMQSSISTAQKNFPTTHNQRDLLSAKSTNMLQNPGPALQDVTNSSSYNKSDVVQQIIVPANVEMERDGINYSYDLKNNYCLFKNFYTFYEVKLNRIYKYEVSL